MLCYASFGTELHRQFGKALLKDIGEGKIQHMSNAQTLALRELTIRFKG